MKKTVIQASNTISVHFFKELWDYKELFVFLALRNILIRYKQTFMGISWAVIRPVLTMVIFSVIFGKVAKLPSEGVPYPILTFVALLPWQFFSNSIVEGSNSLIGNTNIISKVYLPRLILPVSAILSGIIDFAIAFLILIFMMVGYKIYPSVNIIWLPFFFFLAVVASLGISLWFATLNVEYRDVRYLVPFAVQMGLYVSPVGFSSSIISSDWRLLYSMNPMVGVIDGFRWALLGQDTTLYWQGLVLSIFIVFIVTTTGFYYFRKTETKFADII